MKTLTKGNLKQKSEIVGKVGAAHSELEAAIDAFNKAMDDARGPVEAALEKYNAALEEAGEFACTVHGDMQTYFDDKSETWQESDAGQSYAEWMREWESLTLDQVDVDWPQEMEAPESAVETLDALPDAVE